MDFHLLSAEEVFAQLSSGSNGLTQAEAEKRILEYGANRLQEKKKESLIKRFFKQLADPMILILIAAAIISGISSAYSGESFADVFIILFVVILNSILGVVQESKAEKAIEALKKMSASTSKVIRDGNIKTIRSEDLVIGDIILVEAGDAIPADARLIECASIKAEEAALTGESVPVNKQVETLSRDEKELTLGDRRNMIYTGSSIVYGRGRAVVTSTGMNTEMGKIATAITEATEGQTPLQIKLSQLSKILTFLVLGISVFMFIFSIFRSGSFDTEVIINSFMLAVSLAVAAIPEGLVAVVTIVLSMGVTKMAKHNAIIRRLTAVETLGCTQVICSDKTGTLTQNKMTVVDSHTDNTELLAKAMALCSDAELDETNNAVGEPTECALVNYAYKLSFNKNQLKAEYPRIGEAPFDSSRKMMTTVHTNNSKIIQYTKGAVDEVLKKCTHIFENGAVVALDETKKQNILNENKNMANKALRVLAAAYKNHDKAPEKFGPEFIENDLIFIGIVGMIDPIRPEVVKAIKECKQAGIRTVMITGDHIDTAIAIATELKIITSDKDQAITGSALNTMSDEELLNNIEKYSVYARVQPEHKVRIVNTWRKKDMITAMTGDGVNDAPSIKSADIGIGMGITGTDVTKNVADMVLSDDNFATIVYSVAEGRRIYENIRKSIQFLLASNLSEVISIFVATLLGFTILKPVHILWINLITDTFPALALGMEESEPDVMLKLPRKRSESIFAGGVGADIAYQGAVISLITIASYFVGHYIESGVWEIANSADGMTMAFLTMSMAEIFHGFNMRSRTLSIFKMKSHNKFMYGAMILSFILTFAVIYTPGLSAIFEFEHISAMEYIIAIALAFTIIPIVEIIKFIKSRFTKKGKK